MGSYMKERPDKVLNALRYLYGMPGNDSEYYISQELACDIIFGESTMFSMDEQVYLVVGLSDSMVLRDFIEKREPDMEYIMDMYDIIIKLEMASEVMISYKGLLNHFRAHTKYKHQWDDNEWYSNMQEFYEHFGHLAKEEL